jgi:hypothetical protein
MHAKIKDLIAASDRTLTDISAEAGVSFHVLFNWYSGRTVSLDVEVAEAVYQELTGKRFL